jgi:processive 1,2-diacylglycerol beta-glucosyltransferase
MKEEACPVINHNPRIMILTASYGDGHLQASKALRQEFLDQGIDQVQVIDLMKEAHPLLNTISTSLYVKSTQISRFGLDYYGWSYYLTRDTNHDVSLTKYVNILGKKKLKEKINQNRPDVIINTFPYGAAPALGRELGIPTFSVITDYALHARWIHPDIDKYFVSTEELKNELMAKGVTRQRIEISGIPIRQAFVKYNYSKPNKFLNQLHPDKKTILILAGSYGVLKNIDEMVQALSAISHCQIAVVCGRNQKLEKRLQTHYGENPDVHIFGFIEHIHELMSISSCIVTKAGGLTISEAIALQVPLFIYKPFAGQEKENAIFLSEKKAALISNRTEELVDQMRHFLSDEAFSADRKCRMAALKKGPAASNIVKEVIKSIDLIAFNHHIRPGLNEGLNRSIHI